MVDIKLTTPASIKEAHRLKQREYQRTYRARHLEQRRAACRARRRAGRHLTYREAHARQAQEQARPQQKTIPHPSRTA